jgi:hypothetical protein
LRSFDKFGMLASLRHRSHGHGFVFYDEPDPSQAIAADLHGDAAHVVEQLSLAVRAYQRLIDRTESPERPVDLLKGGLGEVALCDVDETRPQQGDF